MLKDNKRYIPTGGLDLSLLSLINSKIRVGIIGGGSAGLIKAKTLKECSIEVLSLEFREEFYLLDNCKLLNSKYKKEFLENKHLIIIATNDSNLNGIIQSDCIFQSKLFINCENSSEGNVVLPAQRKGENFIVGVNLYGGNPRGAVVGVDIAKNALDELDGYFLLSSNLRNKIKRLSKGKDELLNFISKEDFIFFYKCGKEKLILKLFYQEELVEELYKN